MSDWNTDDPQWKEARDRKWKQVEYALKQLVQLEKRDIKGLEVYFKTGIEDAKLPLLHYDGSFLYDIWFQPCPSFERWDELKKRYDEFKIGEAGVMFSSIASNETYKYLGDSFFGGLEERLYHYLMPQHFGRDLFPKYSDKKFNKKAFNMFRGLAAEFNSYFVQENPSKNSLIQYRSREWHDAIKLAYQERSEFTWLVQWVDKINADRDTYSDEKVALAEKLEAIVENDDLPGEAKEKVKMLRAMEGWPDIQIKGDIV